ncbi:MAG: glycosyltransferase, partial [Gemmatimonadota bacterium]
MSRLQVVHLCRGRDWRGGERQVRLLARMLAGRSDLSQLIATGRTSRLAEAVLSDGQPVLLLSWSAAHDPRAWPPLVRQLRRLKRGDGELLLHAHDSHGLALGVLVATLLRLPLVATRRSVSPAGLLWRRPLRVIAISHAVEQELLQSGVSRRRIVRVASAIELAEVRRVGTSQESAGEMLIAVGALTPEKGHATLIDAVGLLARTRPGIRLRIFGEGSERGALEAQINRIGAGSRVVLAGETETAAAQIAAAQLFIQPSHREALGTAVLDAMALGVPVVAS